MDDRDTTSSAIRQARPAATDETPSTLGAARGRSQQPGYLEQRPPEAGSPAPDVERLLSQLLEQLRQTSGNVSLAAV